MPTSINFSAKPLAGKRALVTGAAKRIGREITIALGELGADVCITYNESAEAARATVDDLKRLKVRAEAVRCDLADVETIAPAIAEATEFLGGMDLLVNNAGVFASAAMDSISVAEWDGMFAVNTRAPFFVAQAALPALRQARGRIVNIGSLGGLHPWATHAHYCTSKAALHMLSKTMAKAWAPEVSVNCVAPGMIVQGEVGAMYGHIAEKTPMQRNGTASEVAEAVMFFATAPHFITGQLLAVDGGLGL